MRQLVMHAQLFDAFRQNQVKLIFADGSRAEVRPAPRGLTGLPIMFWLLTLSGLALYLAGVVVVLAHGGATCCMR